MKPLSNRFIPTFLLLTIGALLTSFAAVRFDKGNDPEMLLEVEGKPSFGKKASGGMYRVTLIYLNHVVEQRYLPVDEEFTFELEKNAIYSVRVEKEGYLPRLISINTAMPEEYGEHAFYKFTFDVEMYNGSLEKYLDADDIDFPVAVISYDEKSDRYDYSRNYTQCAIQRLEEVKVGTLSAEQKISAK